MAKPQDRSSAYRWDDVRVFLALMRGRTLGAAGARLGVDATTIGRRLTALEETLGTTLFDRTREGVLPTAAAEQLLAAAEETEQKAAALFAEANALESEPQGVVRVSAPPLITEVLLVPLLGALGRRYPDVRLELDGKVAMADLTRREADLALRTRRPGAGDLVMTRLLTARYALYAAPELASVHRLVDRLDALPWVGWTEAQGGLAAASWLRRHVAATPVLRASELGTQVAAARAGFGAILLAEGFGEMLGLVPLITRGEARRALEDAPEEEVWLVGHRALRNVPRVAAVWEVITGELTGLTSRGARRAEARRVS